MRLSQSLLVITTVAACGSGKVSLRSAGPPQLEQGLVNATIAISSISLSETGESWTQLAGPTSVTIDGPSSLDLSMSELPTGEYHGVKVELGTPFSLTMDDSSTTSTDYPEVLLYNGTGTYRYSNSGNGLPDSVQYFEFTSRNGQLAGPVIVESAETSVLVLTLEPKAEFGRELAAKAVYTSFNP